MASDLIASSDRLVTQLGVQTDKNSNGLILYQIIFAILIIGIQILILYLVARMLKPIFDLTQATSKIKEGNFDVLVRQKGRDELSVLTESFNSMIASTKDFIKNQNDLTRKLEVANEELKNKDQLKDEFINIAAHELRAPIQPILGLAEVLRNRLSNGELGDGSSTDSSVSKQDLEHVDIIIRNAKRLIRLEQNMLDMAKIESKSLQLDKETFDLIEKIQNVINDFTTELSKEKIQLVFTAPSQKEPIFVSADKVRMYEVISNLLNNAIKFTTKEAGRSITIRAEKKDSQASVSINDTGSGIQPDTMPKLFSKFVTNSPGGTGVGLFISKKIVEAHGGRIWAGNNAEGKGATFSFSLPTSEKTRSGSRRRMNRANLSISHDMQIVCVVITVVMAMMLFEVIPERSVWSIPVKLGDEHMLAVPASGGFSLLQMQKQGEEHKAATIEQEYEKQYRFRKRILIVDDEPDITIAFEKAFRDKGFGQIDSFNDPMLALRNFKAGSYDLLIIDIMMPQMDGFELHEEIRKIDTKVKVCFITAFEVNYQALRAIFSAASATDDIGCFIRKPVDVADLIKRIEQY